MELEKLVPVALAAVLAAAAAGRLPDFIREVQLAQLKLLKASESKAWGHAFLLPLNHQPKKRVGAAHRRGLLKN